MPSKNQKLGQLSFKAAVQTNMTNTTANNAIASAADLITAPDGDKSDTAAAPTNSEILRAIQLLKEGLVKKKCTDMLAAVNTIQGDIVSQSKRIRENEERISQTQEFLWPIATCTTYFKIAL